MIPDQTESVLLPSGSRVFYEVSGDGPILLQIGGGALSKRQFSRLTPILAKSFQVIDVDLPGFGSSDPPSHGGTISGWAGDARELISVLDLGSVNVHGISTGAAIAIGVAAADPNVVDRLVVGAHLARMDGYASLMRSTWISAALQGGMRMAADLVAVSGFSRSFLDQPEAEEELEWMRATFEQADPRTFVEAMKSLLELDQGELLHRIEAPTLLMGGVEDVMTPIDAGPSGIGLREMAKRIPRSVLVVFERRGHCYFLEDPVTAATAMTSFLNGDEVLGTSELSVVATTPKLP